MVEKTKKVGVVHTFTAKAKPIKEKSKVTVVPVGQKPTIQKRIDGQPVNTVGDALRVLKQREIRENALKEKELKTQKEKEAKIKEENAIKTKAESLDIVIRDKSILQLQKEIAQRNKEIKNSVTKDLSSGVLSRESGFDFRKFRSYGKLVFHSDRFKELNKGEEFTVDDIKYRYGLGKGKLQDANNFHLEVGQMEVGKGDDIGLYTPRYLHKKDVDIPISDEIKKDLDYIDKY